ncbi:hypothetical protein HOY82DRAFT_641443 [Tuber indicum]|nr:hypothetical protein HOY82DRAFT_641443 [Tuber indicum]
MDNQQETQINNYNNFLISLDRGYIRFSFKISLNTIKSILNVGNVTVEKRRNRCSFLVQDFSEIKDVICPIFLQFPLLTNFHQAVLIKNKKFLSNIDKNRIISLKNGMNSKREIFKSFLEGEGTFGIKTGSSMYLQVAQKNSSIDSLNAIIAFLTSLKSNLPEDRKILPLNVLSTINKKTNVVSLVVTLILKIHGYYYLPEGKKLFLDISGVLNKRYSTGSIKDLDRKIADIFNRYQAILLMNSPFNIEDNIPHVDNVRKFRLENKSDIPKTIYIYENGKLIKGSPFNSYSTTHKALGLKSTSNTCNRYLDTNRLYKSKYIFTSNPLSSTKG